MGLLSSTKQGGGQPCSHFAYIIAKYDTAGNILAQATDPGQEPAFSSCFRIRSSSGQGVAVLNGNIYAAGNAHDTSDISRPTIWKHDTNLNVVWKQYDSSIEGDFTGVTALGGAIYTVGATRGSNQDFIVQKYDENGNQLWSNISGGANTDYLTGVVGVGSRLFAVGYTNSEGAGGYDAVVLEIDPVTGNILSTTTYGGAQDDKANDVATDGTDLYVVGESRSFASADGNTVGQNDIMLLRYTLGSLVEDCSNGIDDDGDGLADCLDPDCFNKDEDGDGFIAQPCGIDCDDNDPDNFPLTYYADTDGDGYGSTTSQTQACEQPAGYVTNNTDNCPLASNPDQADVDNDNIGDACDSCPNDPLNDVDEDGVCGDVDNCPTVANSSQSDIDGDGIGDECDNDKDGDGIDNLTDNCPDTPNADQADFDNDGQGDVCDPDDDGDGIDDASDSCPLEDARGFDTNGDGCIDSVDHMPALIESITLPQGVENSLLSTVNNAMKSLDKENTNAAINQINAFINNVNAQRGKKISEEDAQMLIDFAEMAIDQI